MASELSDSKVHVLTQSFASRSAFYEHLFHFDDTIVVERAVSALSGKDALVLLCSNSYGIPTHSTAEVLEHLHFPARAIRHHINTNYLGEQPPGSAFMMDLPILSGTPKEREKTLKHYKGPRFLVWVCVSRTPHSIPHDYAYTGTWAGLAKLNELKKTMKSEKNEGKEKKQLKNKFKPIKSVIIPDVCDLDADLEGRENREVAVRNSTRQMAMAIKAWVRGSIIDVDDIHSAERRQSSIIQDGIYGRKELEIELEGLLWSREIDTRGLCSQLELDVLIDWVNTDSPNCISSANAICSLLHRDETEFALSQQTISKRITDPTDGCLKALLELSNAEKITVHQQILKSDLVFGSKIGTGNAGEVYKGLWKKMPVAIKTFGDSNVDEKEFHKEMDVLSLVKGPAVVRCFGGSVETGNQYIVMELMEASLYDLLQESSFELDEDLRYEFALHTATAMNYLHNCGLIHRDLKSLNILVSKVFEVKICDFGLSRVVDKNTAMTSNIGTVAWIAPEVFAKKHYTEKADVYSYGIILWELQTRQMPFGEVEMFSVPLLVTRGQRPHLPEDCSPLWRSLIKKCWEQRPNRRPSFAEVIRKLRQYRLDTAAAGQRGQKKLKRRAFGRKGKHRPMLDQSSSTSSFSSSNLAGSQNAQSTNLSSTNGSLRTSPTVDFSPIASEDSSNVSQSSSESSTSFGRIGAIKGIKIESKRGRRGKKGEDSTSSHSSFSSNSLTQSVTSFSSQSLLTSSDIVEKSDSSPSSSVKIKRRKMKTKEKSAVHANRISIRNPNVERVVKVPPPYEIVFSKAESEIFKYFSDFDQDTEKGTLVTADSDERYLLLQGNALSVNFHEFISVTFPFKSASRQLNFNQNLHYDLGRAIGRADFRASGRKVDSSLLVMERVALLPVSLAYRGWASTSICEGTSFSTHQDEFKLIWTSEFSFEANSWLEHLKENATLESLSGESGSSEEDSLHLDYCACSLTSGYYSGWVEDAVGFPISTAEILCRARGDSTCMFVCAATESIVEHVAEVSENPPDILEAGEGASTLFPRFLQERLSLGPGSKISWLQQHLELLRKQITGGGLTMKGKRVAAVGKRSRTSSHGTHKGIRNSVSASDRDIPPNLSRVKTADLAISSALTEGTEQHFSQLHFSPRNGSIEVGDDKFVLIRAESLSEEIFSVLLDLFGGDRPESQELAHEFAVNFVYDFGRSIGQADQQLFSTIFPAQTPSQLKAGVVVNMAATGWGMGSLFSVYGDLPSPPKDFSSNEHYFMVGVRTWNNFESHAWHKRFPERTAPSPHCLMASAYIAGWIESNFNIPMMGVETSCNAMHTLTHLDDHCDFVIAHPNQVSHFVKYYLAHTANKKGSKETSLDILAKTRSLRNKTRPGMGNWLKKIIDRDTLLSHAGQVDVEEMGTSSDEESTAGRSPPLRATSKRARKKKRAVKTAAKSVDK